MEFNLQKGRQVLSFWNRHCSGALCEELVKEVWTCMRYAETRIFFNEQVLNLGVNSRRC